MGFMVPVVVVTMRIVAMPVIVTVVIMPVCPAGAEEGQEHQPPAVEAGHAGRCHQKPEGKA